MEKNKLFELSVMYGGNGIIKGDGLVIKVNKNSISKSEKEKLIREYPEEAEKYFNSSVFDNAQQFHIGPASFSYVKGIFEINYSSRAPPSKGNIEHLNNFAEFMGVEMNKENSGITYGNVTETIVYKIPLSPDNLSLRIIF